VNSVVGRTIENNAMDEKVANAAVSAQDLLGFSRSEWLASGMSERTVQALMDCANRGGRIGLGFDAWVELAKVPSTHERIRGAFPRELLERLARELHAALESRGADANDPRADLDLIQRLQQLLYWPIR